MDKGNKMNSDTGHLVDTTRLSELEAEDLWKDGYDRLPEELHDAAKLELAGQKAVYVGKNSSGSIAKHMRCMQKKKQQKEKAARRANRCRA